MANVVVTHCGENGGGGNHVTFTITTARGSITRMMTKDEFLSRPDKEQLADMLITNFRIRAIKNGATTSDDLKTALNGVSFQEI